MNRILSVLILIFVAPLAYAQEEETLMDSAIVSQSASPERALVKLKDFQTILITSLRQEFPRNPGIFSYAHSCRLPDYGPVVTMTLQLPIVYFTRPLMQELERQKDKAEQQANLVRRQIDRAAQVITLRAREAELVQRIDVEYSTKKKSKSALTILNNELDEVRKSLKDLESSEIATVGMASADSFSVNDLEKMLSANYQQLIERITLTVKDVLAEKAPVLADLKNSERITVTAHIRESFVSSQERSIIFILRNEDIEEFRTGAFDLKALKEKVEVRNEPPE